MTSEKALMFFVTLFAGTGIFLVGVKLLTENIEQLATSRVKLLFEKTANKKILNVLIGASTTALIQSSGVTTVLIIGFVNVGIINLYQAAAMIMGANIGTTITAQIASLSAFPITTYIQALTFIGIFIGTTTKNEKLKSAGYIASGFGTIFVGLSLMSQAMSAYKVEIQSILENISNPVILFLIGVFITALVQSSSATTSIIISMSVAGLSVGTGNNEILFIILGTNIGSCVTALMSTIGAGSNAKRASLIHLLFNSVGAAIFFILLILVPDFMKLTFMRWFSETSVQIAMFHTFFNTVCTLMFLPISGLFVKAAELLIKDQPEEKRTVFLDERFFESPMLAISQLKKENGILLTEAMNNIRTGMEGIINEDKSVIPLIKEGISTVNAHSKQIVDYLIKASTDVVSAKNEKTISEIHEDIGDIIRISEIGDNFSKYITRMVNDNLEFSDGTLEQIKNMWGIVSQMGDLTCEIIYDGNPNRIEEINRLEDQVDNCRSDLMEKHIERLNSGLCKSDNAAVFVNLISNIERAADHLTYIASRQSGNE